LANTPFEAASPIVRDDSAAMTLTRLDGLARLMDSAIKIPGTDVAIGFDAALGLLPVIGDAISSVIGAYIIWEAKRLGASRLLIARMATNTTIDTIVGAIPIVGDVFDIAYRSNRKNVALLKAHLERHGVRDSKTIEATYTAR
jgi:Domain of unknown function (DUF4112)